MSATHDLNSRGLRGALATTLGTLSAAPEALPLSDGARAELRRWRDRCWEELERRAGCLAARDASAWYEILAFERWRNDVKTSSLPPSALSFFYRIKRLVPRSMQISLRRLLIRHQGSPGFPAWPFERAGSDLVQIALVDALLEHDVTAIRFPWFWPDGARAAVVLTHDVESEQGLADAGRTAAWEEHHGFRSSFNVVSDWYPIDMDLVGELAQRGHEIGSHAIHHDRSLFSSRREFERQLPLLRESADRLGAVGFRSPATHRVVEWLRELPFSYDCTMPHSDPYEPIPGGTATIWPFFHGDVIELPYSTPQDHTLYTLLGHTDNRLWREQFERVVECNGLFQMLTHPDPAYLGQPVIGRAYRETLQAIADREDIWVALPREVAEWWRRRAEEASVCRDALAQWTGTTVSYGWSKPE
jgi:peptidoglycan/xylan/chitin deacetylase (PgdA/CDA1 family)